METTIKTNILFIIYVRQHVSTCSGHLQGTKFQQSCSIQYLVKYTLLSIMTNDKPTRIAYSSI